MNGRYILERGDTYPAILGQYGQCFLFMEIPFCRDSRTDIPSWVGNTKLTNTDYIMNVSALCTHIYVPI